MSKSSEYAKKPQPQKPLKAIILTIGGKEIRLLPEEAKELRDALTSLWPEKEVRYVRGWDWWQYQYPYWHPTYTITCGSTRASDGGGANVTWTDSTGNVSMTTEV